MLYCDTSFLTPAFRRESSSNSIQRFLRQQEVGELAISHWVRVEFSSVVARDVRMGLMEKKTAIDLDVEFESAVERSFTVIVPDKSDFDLAKRYLQQFDTGLRAGDAMHLAIATNHGAEKIYTLDRKLLRAGKLLSLPVATGVHGEG
jgi:predicted nucleic acid-binding protein